MGRAWRIEYEGGLYHVLSRGNERRDIFHHSRRIPKLIKEDRDLLAYLVWKICILSNEEIGLLFGMM